MKNKPILLTSMIFFMPNVYANTFASPSVTGDVGIACLCILTAVLTKVKK